DQLAEGVPAPLGILRLGPDGIFEVLVPGDAALDSLGGRGEGQCRDSEGSPEDPTAQTETRDGSTLHTARDPSASPRVQRAHFGHEEGASFSLHGRIYASDVGDRRQGGSAVGPAPKGEISAPSERSRTSLPQRVLPQRIRSPWAP